MRLYSKDVIMGGILALVGLFYAVVVWETLPLGSALNMGPGYFPMVLAVITFCLSIVLIVRALVKPSGEPFGVFPWRAAILITLSILIFALLAERLGVLIATFLSSTVASLAGREVRLGSAVVAGAVVSAACAVLFIWALHVPIPLFGSWIVE